MPRRGRLSGKPGSARDGIKGPNYFSLLGQMAPLVACRETVRPAKGWKSGEAGQCSHLAQRASALTAPADFGIPPGLLGIFLAMARHDAAPRARLLCERRPFS